MGNSYARGVSIGAPSGAAFVAAKARFGRVGAGKAAHGKRELARRAAGRALGPGTIAEGRRTRRSCGRAVLRIRARPASRRTTRPLAGGVVSPVAGIGRS